MCVCVCVCVCVRARACARANIAEAQKNPRFITQTKKCTTHTYINNILCIVITPTCFDASASSYLSILVSHKNN